MILAAAAAVALGCNALTSPPERSPNDVPLSEIIALRRLHPASPVPGDGKSLDTLVAAIPSDANTQVITFGTTGGKFDLSNAQQVKVRADRTVSNDASKVEAWAVLRSDTSSQSALVSATVGDFTDTVRVAFQR